MSLEEKNEILSLIAAAVSKIEATKPSTKPEVVETKVENIDALVKEVVEKYLEIFAADRVGIPDYAIQSGGGRIIQHLTSKTFLHPTTLIGSMLNWGAPSEPPSSVIQPNVNRGKCWPMAGTSGSIGIRVSSPIIPTLFHLEHISKLAATDLLSAPKEISIWGYESPYQSEDPVLLAEYTFDITKGPIQKIEPVVCSLFLPQQLRGHSSNKRLWFVLSCSTPTPTSRPSNFKSTAIMATHTTLAYIALEYTAFPRQRTLRETRRRWKGTSRMTPKLSECEVMLQKIQKNKHPIEGNVMHRSGFDCRD